MTRSIFLDQLLFQEKNYFKLIAPCQELDKYIQIQLKNNDKIKQTVNKCQLIGISEKFNIELTEICGNSSKKDLSTRIQPVLQQQHSDADYEKLKQQYIKVQNDLISMTQKAENLREQINDLQWVNQQQIKSIESLKKSQTESNLALSQLTLSNNVFKVQQINDEQTSKIDSDQPQTNSIEDFSSEFNEISISEQSKMVRKSSLISLQTSILDNSTLIDMENKIQKAILVYRHERVKLEQKELDRFHKIVTQKEKIRQKKHKSMNDKQTKLLESQQIVCDKLHFQRQIKFEKEELERKKHEQENRRKQDILNKKTEQENRKLKELLDRERNRIDEKLAKHKNRLGL